MHLNKKKLHIFVVRDDYTLPRVEYIANKWHNEDYIHINTHISHQ